MDTVRRGVMAGRARDERSHRKGHMAIMRAGSPYRNDTTTEAANSATTATKRPTRNENISSGMSALISCVCAISRPHNERHNEFRGISVLISCLCAMSRPQCKDHLNTKECEMSFYKDRVGTLKVALQRVKSRSTRRVPDWVRRPVRTVEEKVVDVVVWRAWAC